MGSVKRLGNTDILKWIIIIALIVLAMGIAATCMWPKQSVESLASKMAGRSVTFENASITFNRSLDFAFDDIHVANQPWGSAPDMVHIGHLSGSFNLRSLLSGRTIFDKLAIKDVTVLLERNDRGTGNWKNPDSLDRRPLSPAEQARRSRLSFPVVLNLLIDNARVFFHTSGGSVLDIYIEKFDLATADQDRPAHLIATGAYNKLPVRLDMQTQSLDDLHDVEKPFGIKGSADGNSIEAFLDLELMDPINFDQLEGTLHANIKNIGVFAAYLGAPFNGNWPVIFNSKMERQQDHWRLSDSKGSFVDSSFTKSELVLDEGKRFEPDSLKADFKIDTLNAGSLIDVDHMLINKRNDKIEWLDAKKNPEILLDAKANVGRAVYRSFKISDVHLHGVIDAGEIGIRGFSLNALGGKASGSAVSTMENENSRLKAQLDLTHIDAKQLMQNMMPGKPAILNGEINLSASATAKGDTSSIIANSLNGNVVLRMKDGWVTRWIDHLAAGDVHALFDASSDRIPVSCVNAVVSFENGFGQLSPFVFQTSEGTLLGQGTIDIPRDKVALLFQTDPKTTSALALDVPISVEGDLADPKIDLAFGHRHLVNARLMRDCSQ